MIQPHPADVPIPEPWNTIIPVVAGCLGALGFAGAVLMYLLRIWNVFCPLDDQVVTLPGTVQSGDAQKMADRYL